MGSIPELTGSAKAVTVSTAGGGVEGAIGGCGGANILAEGTRLWLDTDTDLACLAARASAGIGIAFEDEAGVAMDVDDDAGLQIQPKRKKNKQRVMLLSSRGVTHRMRHLMNDLEVLLPHVKKGEFIVCF